MNERRLPRELRASLQHSPNASLIRSLIRARSGAVHVMRFVPILCVDGHVGSNLGGGPQASKAPAADN